MNNSSLQCSFFFGGGAGGGGGTKVCQTGNADAVTAETKLIEAANIYWNGADVCIYDTQGAPDGEDEEEKIFRSIRSKKINLLIVCVSVVGRAQQADTKETMSLITKEIGSEIWEKANVACKWEYRITPSA